MLRALRGRIGALAGGDIGPGAGKAWGVWGGWAGVRRASGAGHWGVSDLVAVWWSLVERVSPGKLCGLSHPSCQALRKARLNVLPLR